MTPLLFAAALAVSPAAPQPDLNSWTVRRLGPDTTSACAKLESQTVAPDGVPLFRRLDRLPWGLMEHAVWRMVGGCPVREIVFGGQVYYLASGNPRIERLDPASPRQLEKRFGF